MTHLNVNSRNKTFTIKHKKGLTSSSSGLMLVHVLNRVSPGLLWLGTWCEVRVGRKFRLVAGHTHGYWPWLEYRPLAESSRWSMERHLNAQLLVLTVHTYINSSPRQTVASSICPGWVLPKLWLAFSSWCAWAWRTWRVVSGTTLGSLISGWSVFEGPWLGGFFRSW
jgi:hypothetical protein